MAGRLAEDASLTATAVMEGSWLMGRSPSRSPRRHPSTAGTEITDATDATDATESTANPTVSSRTSSRARSPAAKEANVNITNASATASRVGHEEENDSSRASKIQQIRNACVHGNLAELQALAESDGGLLTDELRQVAWPVLLGLPVDDNGQVNAEAAAAKAGIADNDGSTAWQSLPPHRDEEQVQLDVNRAFVYYPIHASPAAEERQHRALSDLIVEVLRRQPYLCYFQGFHDICQVLLLVLPPPLRTPAVLRLAVLRIRDFMLPTIDAAVQQLLLLPDILHAADPPLWAHLGLAQHPRPFFALSGTLTMYAHDMRSLGAIARVFDVLLARPPAFSLYLFAAIVCAHRAALFATPADEPEMLHHILSKLPGDAGEAVKGEKRAGDGLDALVADAARLAARFPPQSLPAWRAVSAASVLKTAADSTAAATQTVVDGERLFRAHVDELERNERRRKQRAHMQKMLRQYRGPLRAVGVAMLVSVVAVWLRRASAGGGPLSAAMPTTYPWTARLGSALARPMTTVASVLSRLGVRIT